MWCSIKEERTSAVIKRLELIGYAKPDFDSAFDTEKTKEDWYALLEMTEPLNERIWKKFFKRLSRGDAIGASSSKNAFLMGYIATVTTLSDYPRNCWCSGCAEILYKYGDPYRDDDCECSVCFDSSQEYKISQYRGKDHDSTACNNGDSRDHD